MSRCVSLAQARTKSGLGSGPRHFICKFPHEVAPMKCLVWVRFGCAGLHKVWVGLWSAKYTVAQLTCPSAFRLRKLAQSVARGSDRWHFSCKCSCKVALVECLSVFRLCTLHKVWVPVLGSALLLNIIILNIIFRLNNIILNIIIFLPHWPHPQHHHFPPHFPQHQN